MVIHRILFVDNNLATETLQCTEILILLFFITNNFFWQFSNSLS